MLDKRVLGLMLCWIGFLSEKSWAQEDYTQTVTGLILDASTKRPLPFTNVMVVDSDPPIGAITDTTGRFVLRNVPIGRVAIQASFIGYDPINVSEILVSTGRQTQVNIEMNESSAELGEVVVQAKESKNKALNSMSTVSARKFNVEEASRYAGGFDDPARLATSYAGVAGGIGNNGIVIRGNSPRTLLWRMEGVEIPNPSHFADVVTFGAGGLSALSSRMIDNSDFYTGAFPAEYSNALGGVFDLNVRKGNTLKRQYTAEVGVNGIEASTEGPFKKGKQSTYLINYRYSTLALLTPLLPEDAAGITYQDVSFKVNFPTQKAGTFSVWGLGSMDNSGQIAETDSTKWFYDQDKGEADVFTAMGAAGINHQITVKEKTLIKTLFATTGNLVRFDEERMDSTITLQPYSSIRNDQWKYTLSSSVNHRFGAKHTLRAGVILNYLNYDIGFSVAPTLGQSLQSVVEETGGEIHTQAFVQSQIRVHPQFRINVGLHGQYFNYNQTYSIEPRLGMSWNISDNHTLSLGYGTHGQLEKLNFYMIQNQVGGNTVYPNRNLGFSKAQHVVLGYDWSINPSLRFKAEAYYQYLYDLPIGTSGSFALLNLNNDWFFRDSLVNNGTGQNYGLELTFERFLKKGYFYLFSGSVFNSEYTANGQTYSTRYNTNFVVNLLGGKEWSFGKHKQHRVSTSLKFTLQGGDRISPVDEAASIAAQEVVYDETRAFSNRKPLVYLLHANLGVTFNGKKVAHTIAVKVINASATKEYLGHRYNYRTDEVEGFAERTVVPNLSYKIEF